MKSRTRTSLREDLADLYDDFAIGWNELFDEESASTYKKNAVNSFNYALSGI